MTPKQKRLISSLVAVVAAFFPLIVMTTPLAIDTESLACGAWGVAMLTWDRLDVHMGDKA